MCARIVCSEIAHIDFGKRFSAECHTGAKPVRWINKNRPLCRMKKADVLCLLLVPSGHVDLLFVDINLGFLGLSVNSKAIV